MNNWLSKIEEVEATYHLNNGDFKISLQIGIGSDSDYRNFRGTKAKVKKEFEKYISLIKERVFDDYMTMFIHAEHWYQYKTADENGERGYWKNIFDKTINS